MSATNNRSIFFDKTKGSRKEEQQEEGEAKTFRKQRTRRAHRRISPKTGREFHFFLLTTNQTKLDCTLNLPSTHRGARSFSALRRSNRRGLLEGSAGVGRERGKAGCITLPSCFFRFLASLFFILRPEVLVLSDSLTRPPEQREKRTPPLWAGGKGKNTFLIAVCRFDSSSSSFFSFFLSCVQPK